MECARMEIQSAVKLVLIYCILAFSNGLHARTFEYECQAELNLFGDNFAYEVIFTGDIDFRQNDSFIFNDVVVDVFKNGDLVKESLARKATRIDQFNSEVIISFGDNTGLIIDLFRESFTINYDLQIVFFFAPGRGKFSEVFQCVTDSPF